MSESEEVSGVALLVYAAILAGGYLQFFNGSVPLLNYAIGALLIPVVFALMVVYTDVLISAFDTITDKFAQGVRDAWTAVQGMASEESDDEEIETTTSALSQSYNTTYDAEEGKADIVSVSVESDNPDSLSLSLLSASGLKYETTVDIPPAGEWTRKYELPVLCAYMGIAPVWDYENIADVDKSVDIKQTDKEDQPFEIDYASLRESLPSTEETNLTELAEKQEKELSVQTN